MRKTLISIWVGFHNELFSLWAVFLSRLSEFFNMTFQCFTHFSLNVNETLFSQFCRDIPEDVLNTYCWIHSTYTVVDAFMKKQGLEVPFPGIDNSQGGRGPLTIKHNKYYQWVAFTLFFQVSLTLPRKRNWKKNQNFDWFQVKRSIFVRKLIKSSLINWIGSNVWL